MGRMLQNSVVFVVAFFVIFVVAGCGGGGQSASGTSVNPNSLVGTWRVVAMVDAHGHRSNCPTSVLIAPNTTLDCGTSDISRITAINSNTFSAKDISSDSLSISLTMHLSGNRLTVDIPAFPDQAAFTDVYELSFSGNQMTMKLISSTATDPTLGSNLINTSSISERI